MKTIGAGIRQGHYAKKQLLSKDRFIAWSHRRRFEVGLRLARMYSANGCVLDYGCGDGSLLAMLCEGGEGAPRAAVGAELSEGLVEDCRRRLGGRAGLDFVVATELERPEHRGAYDLVVCMEVLEHVVDAGAVVARLARAVAPGGRLIVSVPA